MTALLTGYEDYKTSCYLKKKNKLKIQLFCIIKSFKQAYSVILEKISGEIKGKYNYLKKKKELLMNPVFLKTCCHLARPVSSNHSPAYEEQK